MKYIIDRINTRAENGTDEHRKIATKVHEELMDKYICNEPTVKDLEILFRELQYDPTTNYNFERWLKLTTTFEILTNGNYKLIKENK